MAQYWYKLLALVLQMSLPTCCCTYKEGTSLSSKAHFLFQLCSVPGNQGMHHPVYRSVLVVRILFVIILVLRASVLTCGCLFGKELQWRCRALHPAVLYGPLRRERVCTELPTGLSLLSDTRCDLYLHKPASLKFLSAGRTYLCTCEEITAMPSYYRVIWCVFTSRTAKI